MFTDELANMGYHELTTDENGHIRGRSTRSSAHERWLMWESAESGLNPQEIKAMSQRGERP